jgi:hypothetical protein
MMFDRFRKMFAPEMAPEGPVTFDFEEEIAASAGHIYGLLDFASEHCAKRELGHSVALVGPGHYCFTMWQMADLPFDITVSEAVPGKVYAYRAVARKKVGRLVWSDERHEIQPRGDGSCLVRLVVEAQFDEPMPLAEYGEHVARMAHGCASALEKLRLHAEQGAQAVLDYEDRQFA